MPASTQFELTTPLGSEALRLHKLQAHEALGQISEFQLECLSDKADLDLDAILGKLASVRITLPEHGERFLTGYVTRFSHTGTVGRYQTYKAYIQPWTWFLTRTTDCRIFQNKSVPEIIKEIFTDHQGIAEFRDALSSSYAKREYCVQYRETDFNFISRLMEDEGIYFFFEYAKDKNILVLADSYSAHAPVPGEASFEFVDNYRAQKEASDHIHNWHFERIVQAGKTRLVDYDFKRPKVKLDAASSQPREHAQAEHEVFDYPGGFVEQTEGDRLARVRIDELQVQYELAQARTNARAIGCGMLFKLSGHARHDQNREYLVTATHTTIEAEGLEAHQQQSGSNYLCEITALASQHEFHPTRCTPCPVVRGPQTALVVGPAGDEIHTDKFGRVKVQFHWDRMGKKDENSSCWMRVSHPWAGKNWGFVAIPRIGQEVVVEFLEGDPDRPLITGSVYNGEQMPPYELPANMTQSGIKSRSSKGGTPENFNEIRFEDKKGEEQVFIHAEKNQDIEIEHDETHWVGNNRSKTIDNDETVVVGSNRKENVGANENISIGANRSESVGANETISIGGNRAETVGANETITIGAGRTKSVGASETVTVGGSQITSIGGSVTEIIGAAVTQTVGAALTQKVGGAWTMSASGPVTISAPAGLTIISPGGNRTVDSFFDKIGGSLKEKFGDKMTAADKTLTITGLALATTFEKIETTDLSYTATNINMEVKGLNMSYVGIKCEKASFEIQTAAAHIIA